MYEVCTTIGTTQHRIMSISLSLSGPRNYVYAAPPTNSACIEFIDYMYALFVGGAGLRGSTGEGRIGAVGALRASSAMDSLRRGHALSEGVVWQRARLGWR